MNKIFTLLAAAGLAMSANATVLWEGEVVMGSWKGEMYYKNVPENDQWKADAMSNMKVGDKLVFTYKDNVGTADKPAQIQMASFGLDNDWTWTNVVEYADINGTTYTYEINEDIFGDWTDLEMLSARGFAVKGQNATLVKVELLGAGETGGNEGGGNQGGGEEAQGAIIWKGEVVMGNWKGEMYYKNVPENDQWNNAVMSKLAVGDKLVFTYKDIEGSADKPAQIQMASFGLDNNWTWTNVVEYANIVNGKYTYEITEDIFGDWTDLEMLSERGFAVKGQNATLVQVEVVKAGQGGGDDTPTGGLTALWEGSTVMGNWAGMLEYKNVPENAQWNNAVMSKLAVGDKLIFTYTDNVGTDEKPAQIQFVSFGLDANWTWTQIVEYADIVNDKYIYEINEDIFGDWTDLEMLSERGFAVKGQNATLVKVELQKAGAGVENVTVDTAIDLNAPVEIYTIDGRRVNEMTQGRIYIVRQGNKVAKIAK